MAEPIRIALLHPCFWPEVRRGSERFLHDLAVGLVERGQRPRLITSHPGPSSRQVEEGFEVIRNHRPRGRRLQVGLRREYVTHLPLSYRTLAAGDDDVVHAAYPTDALAAARWGRRRGRPVVFSYMGLPRPSGLQGRPLWRRVQARAVARADAVTALSRKAAERIWEWFRAEARVIHPGVDLAAFAPDGDRAPEPTIFCASAADDPRKRVGLLLEAFSLVRRRRPGARLVVSRPSDARLAEQLERSGPGVEVVPIDSAQVASLYRAAWVSVLPSLDEAFGLVLVESLACGTPVVGSEHGAIPEIVTSDSVGRLFAGDDSAALATALLEALELAEDPETWAACRTHAEGFSSQRFTHQYLQLYRELLHSGE